jgi:hypothetical protein
LIVSILTLVAAVLLFFRYKKATLEQDRSETTILRKV